MAMSDTPGRRRALLVAADEYVDPALTRLRAPVGDVTALAEVLGEAMLGDFEVRRLITPSGPPARLLIPGEPPGRMFVLLDME
jgi:hypothetical protein